MKKITMLLTSFCILVSTGCNTNPIKSFPANPDTFSIDSKAIPKYKAGTRISIENAYKSKEPFFLYENDSIQWKADKQQYTQAAITMLSRELKKQELIIENANSKSVVLKVTFAYSGPAGHTGPWTYMSDAGIGLEAKLGNGNKVKAKAKNSSPASVSRAVDGALMKAITELLKNKEFYDYINSN